MLLPHRAGRGSKLPSLVVEETKKLKGFKNEGWFLQFEWLWIKGCMETKQSKERKQRKETKGKKGDPDSRKHQKGQRKHVFL